MFGLGYSVSIKYTLDFQVVKMKKRIKYVTDFFNIDFVLIVFWKY